MPRSVLEEWESIKKENQMISGAEAFNQLAKYARIGREVDHLRQFQFFRKKKKGKGGDSWLP